MSTAKTFQPQIPVASKIYSELPQQILMPHNLQLEESILGQILLDQSAFKIANRILDVDSFYKGAHQTIWKACEKLNQQTQPIDLITVTETIRKSGLLGKASKLENQKLNISESRKRTKLLKYGITPYELVEMTNRVASAANLEYHCRILYQFYLRRVAIEEAELVKQKALDMTEDIFETFDSVTKNFRSKNPQNVLTFKSMNDTMIAGAKEPPAKRMAGSLLHENSVIIIFSDPGTGKTIFSTQIGDVLSRGINLFGIKDFHNSTQPKKVLLFDFEMEEAEIYGRYKRADVNAYSWHKNFFRCGINPSFIDFEDADTLITNEIQLQIEEQNPDIAIVDNITYISSESSDPKMATKLMKKLLAIQKRSSNKLALIIIAHTPKRDPSLPIELRHLAGAKSLSNFAKNVIAVSKSKLDPSLRYVKQLKCRQDVENYNSDNVIVCAVNKNMDNGRLEYEFQGYGREVDHLLTPDIEEQEPAILEECIQLRKAGKSWRQLADHIKTEYGITMTHTTVMRKIKKLSFDVLTEQHELKEFDEAKENHSTIVKKKKATKPK